MRRIKHNYFWLLPYFLLHPLELPCLQVSMGYATGAGQLAYSGVLLRIGQHEQFAVPFSQVGTSQDRNDGV